MLHLRVIADPFYRLADGPTGTARGRVEVFINGNWGTIHKLQGWWYKPDINVLCKSLGFSSGDFLSATGQSELTPTGTGTVWEVRPACSGHESDIMHCRFTKEWTKSSDERHELDLAVACFTDGKCYFCLSVSRLIQIADGVH